MDQDILDPDAARERLAAWRGRIDKLAADTREMGERLRAVRVTARDPGGLAEVTVDSTGALVGLRLTDRIGRVSPDVVARTILAALGDARNQLADRSRDIVADTVGAESAAGRAIVESVGRHLRGAPTPEGTAAPARPAPTRPAPTRTAAPSSADDEDYAGESYLDER
ncbi:YbaB/EbfC family nucleoid-associated protein [Saccharothrix syringae]|uniref:YbaB/EbfC family DNA-binding protein n=1 Tax=Saccharothrix syringae TaxID=103733 RepID=A0A5Q0H483_SACSY|nr:YbaB/EbfC family nucleoid-associated protein [Saccharothrix syringae]QFZ21031.1 YbaB/EbfC family DNA-binding protein [Saccharothrix syringae]